MGEGSPGGSTDIPPTPSDNEQSTDIPPPDKLWKIYPLTEQCALNRSVAIWSTPNFHLTSATMHDYGPSERDHKG